MELGFPSWLCITHYINFLFLTLLVRSGIQILADHPRLYFNDHCTPGTEWIKFTKKKVPRDEPYTSHDDEVSVSSWIALPGGRHQLGLGRHWHAFCAFFWLLNGLIYVALLFGTDNWRRLIPTSWSIFPEAGKAFITYATFHSPPASDFHPYDGLQQLAYAFVVFILAPLAILTGPALSPAISARFPWYPKLLGGRQMARSLHFLMMVGFVVFLIIHVILVFAVRFPLNMENIALAGEKRPGLAIAIGLIGIASVIAIHFLVTKWSKKKPRQVQQATGLVLDSLNQTLFYSLKSKQEYTPEQRSPYFWANGHPPKTPQWLKLSENHFQEYRLEVHGRIQKPLKLSLEDLKKMPFSEQTTMHCCIQGWSGIATWGGVALSEVIQIAQPTPEVKYIVFRSFQQDDAGETYYTTLDMKEAYYPQTLLAYQMNDHDLAIAYGAPLRLRVETKLGFKMIKWLKSIEFVENFHAIGLGQGGYKEDREFFSRGAQM